MCRTLEVLSPRKAAISATLITGCLLVDGCAYGEPVLAFMVDAAAAWAAPVVVESALVAGAVFVAELGVGGEGLDPDAGVGAGALGFEDVAAGCGVAHGFDEGGAAVEAVDSAHGCASVPEFYLEAAADAACGGGEVGELGLVLCCPREVEAQVAHDLTQDRRCSGGLLVLVAAPPVFPACEFADC